MRKGNVAGTATTKWALLFVFATKRHGSLRSCVGYRKLNNVTVYGSYLIPRMDECIVSFGTANVFSTLDVNGGYWQADLDENVMNETALVAYNKLNGYTCMSFCMKNAPATFQLAMDIILAPVKWQHALVYMGNVVIFFRTSEEHSIHAESGQQLT